MGVRDIHDGRDSLLTTRLENLRRVERREGEAGGGGGSFQQVFEFTEQNEENEKREPEKETPERTLELAAPPRAITPEQIDKVKKRNELKPGQILDIEA